MTGLGGLALTIALLAALVGRLIVGAGWFGRGDRRAWLRAFDVALVPLLVGFVAVVIVRFDQLNVVGR